MKARQKPGVIFQPHVHHALQRGIYQMVSAIRPTLGPLSSGVAIDHLNQTNPLPEFLDDGGVIARRIIELNNRDEDVGAMLVRAMILRQHERIGDGTATTAVLFEAIFNAALRYIAAGGNAMQLRRHLERAHSRIDEALDAMTFKLDGQDDLTHMALSLCHNEELANLMGESFDLVGEYGRIEIREGYGRRLHREFVEGNHFYAGLISHTTLSENASDPLKLANPAIFLCDFNIQDRHALFPVLQVANEADVSGLVIIARELSEDAVSLLTIHNRMDKFKVAAVKLPGLNPDDRVAAIEDLSLLTGATPFLQVTGDTLAHVTAQHFGSTRRFWADRHAFGCVSGRGNPRKLREHIHHLQARFHKLEKVGERKQLQERIGNLLGGTITLWVGGFSLPEINAQKSLVEKTALTLRSAVETGVVPGGGVALLKCCNLLAEELSTIQDTDGRAAYRILIEALAEPARTIFRNAGYDPGSVMGKLLDADANAGFDVVTNRVVDMRTAGILDSASVIKTCVRNAIQTAGLALTIDSVVHLSHPEMVGNPE